MSDNITIEQGESVTTTITITPPNQPETVIEVIDQQSVTSIVTVGVPGPPGQMVTVPDYFTAIGGEVIGGHRVVNVYDGTAFYANNIDKCDGQLGLTMSSSIIGEELRLFTSGVVIEPTWNFSKGYIFLGDNGLLTQTKPDTGFVIVIGKAISPQSMLIHIYNIYRSL